MSPLVYSHKARRNVPVMYVYRDVMEGINALAEKNDAGKKFKQDVLGEQTIEEAPAAYFDMALALDLHLAEVWDGLDLHLKARIRAQRYISGMVDVIERYRREQKRVREEASKPKGK